MTKQAGAQPTPDLAEPRWRRLILARAGTRLIVAAALGSMMFAFTMALTAWQVALLTGLDITTGVVVVWVFIAVWSRTSDETARLARREDDSRAAAHVLLVSAAVASLVAVGFGLVKAAGEDSFAKTVITALAVLSVALSWAAVQATDTLRYAHVYYGEHGGIDFIAFLSLRYGHRGRDDQRRGRPRPLTASPRGRDLRPPRDAAGRGRRAIRAGWGARR